MMKLKTSKGKTYNVDWVDVATMTSNDLFLQLKDERPLGKIAAEFDGLEWMERESETQGNKRFEGFNQLVSIMRTMNFVQMSFKKGA